MKKAAKPAKKSDQAAGPPVTTTTDQTAAAQPTKIDEETVTRIRAASPSSTAVDSAGCGVVWMNALQDEWLQQQRMLHAAQSEPGGGAIVSTEGASSAQLDFVNRQVQALNEAFGTISDVLIEEVDSIRTEMARQHEEIRDETKTLRGEMARQHEQLCDDVQNLRNEMARQHEQIETRSRALQSEMRQQHEQIETDAAEQRGLVMALRGQVSSLANEFGQLRQQIEKHSAQHQTREHAAGKCDESIQVRTHFCCGC